MIAAIILAAGQSKRMGQPKMLLPWGETTVLGQVVATLAEGGVDDILVVTGGNGERVQVLVAELAKEFPVRSTVNSGYAQGEMLSSLQVGLSALRPGVEATLIALGDQPQAQVRTVQRVIEAYHSSGSSLVIPSYQMRRGHPWLVARSLWPVLLEMRSPLSARDFLQSQADQIHYIDADTPTILQDLDTPEDYEHYRQKIS
jgi:molybdenum cofactor cytidylyltransferase